MKYINYLLVFMFLALTACEDIDENFKQYLDEGTERYIGKVKDVEIEAGFNRFKYTWSNTLDKTVENIKFVWENKGVKDSVVLDVNELTYTSEAIFNKNVGYSFTVYSVDHNGKHSLPQKFVKRPYTLQHEKLLTLSTLERKTFIVGDKVLLLLGSASDNVKESILTYYEGDVEMTHAITPDERESGKLLLINVNTSKEIKVNQKIMLPDCFDEIQLPSYEIDKNRVLMNIDFKDHCLFTYNLNTLTPEWINNLEVLHLDYDLMSIEDILYFPNLKTIKIGSNRFFHNDYTYGTGGGGGIFPATDDPNGFPIWPPVEIPIAPELSKLTGENAKDVAKEVLNMLHSEKSVAIEFYNNHYDLSDDLSWISTKESNPVFDLSTLISTEGWEITCNTDSKDFPEWSFDYYSSESENLLDGNENTDWRPADKENEIRKHELIIDMQEMTSVTGVMIQQSMNEYSKDKYPGKIEIEVSSDGNQWSDALLQSVHVLGNGTGEKTIVPFINEMEVQFIKIFIKDQSGYRNNVWLSEVGIY